jgi:hypothetical protein
MRYQHLFATLSLIFVAACSGDTVKDTFGLSHEAPDEYRVVTRPPLSVPPEFNLEPPAAPGDMPAKQATDKQAKSLLTGKPVEDSNTFKLRPANAPAPTATKADVPAAKTTPEANFLQKAGATQADPNVRSALERDKIAAKPIEEEDRSWWNPRGWWSTDKKEPEVLAKQEAERLKKNKETGKPANEGEVPETKERDTGVLGKILGY